MRSLKLESFCSCWKIPSKNGKVPTPIDLPNFSVIFPTSIDVSNCNSHCSTPDNFSLCGLKQFWRQKISGCYFGIFDHRHLNKALNLSSQYNDVNNFEMSSTSFLPRNPSYFHLKRYLYIVITKNTKFRRSPLDPISQLPWLFSPSTTYKL